MITLSRENECINSFVYWLIAEKLRLARTLQGNGRATVSDVIVM